MHFTNCKVASTIWKEHKKNESKKNERKW